MVGCDVNQWQLSSIRPYLQFFADWKLWSHVCKGSVDKSVHPLSFHVEVLLCSLVLVARILCWKVDRISSFFFKFEIRQLNSSIGPF
jgi:hypothetical protein